MRHIKYKVGILLLKYIPIFMSFILLVHVGLLLIGIHTNIAENIAGISIMPAIVIIAMSEVLHFCLLHKLFTIYSLVVDFCINYHREIGFCDSLLYLRIIVFIIGISLFSYLFLHFKRYKRRGIKRR